MLQEITGAVNHINIGLLFILSWFFALKITKIKNGVYPFIVAFGGAIYLISYKEFIRTDFIGLLTSISMYITIFFHYFFVKSLYVSEISFKKREWFLLIGYVTLCIFSHQIRFGNFSWTKEGNGFVLILKMIPQFLNFIIVGLIIKETVGGIKDDLINSRILFRKWLTFCLGFIILSNTVASIGLNVSKLSSGVDLFFNLIILVPVVGFIINNLNLSETFFVKKQKSLKIDSLDEDLEEIKVQLDKLIEEKIYLKEGISIYDLSKEIKCKDYKLRKLINTQLGFRNFNDFLNFYRVNEAKEILSNPTKNELTILEIAYSLGYNSISPFNNAFKVYTGVTPTQFKSQYTKNPS